MRLREAVGINSRAAFHHDGGPGSCGGWAVQGETSGLGELVRVARPRTERPEAELAGTVNRTGTHRQLLVGEVTLQLDPGEAYRGMVNAVDASGGGHTVKRAVAALH